MWDETKDQEEKAHGDFPAAYWDDAVVLIGR